jgi:hypothetical protein
VGLREAQESLELIRLRLEQVGLSNPAVWGANLKDANFALKTVSALSEGREELVAEVEGLLDSIRSKDNLATLIKQVFTPPPPCPPRSSTPSPLFPPTPVPTFFLLNQFFG